MDRKKELWLNHPSSGGRYWVQGLATKYLAGWLGRFPDWDEGSWTGGLLPAMVALLPLSSNSPGDPNPLCVEGERQCIVRCSRSGQSDGWAPRCASSMNGNVRALAFCTPRAACCWPICMATAFRTCNGYCIRTNFSYRTKGPACQHIKQYDSSLDVDWTGGRRRRNLITVEVILQSSYIVLLYTWHL